MKCPICCCHVGADRGEVIAHMEFLHGARGVAEALINATNIDAPEPVAIKRQDAPTWNECFLAALSGTAGTDSISSPVFMAMNIADDAQKQLQERAGTVSATV